MKQTSKQANKQTSKQANKQTMKKAINIVAQGDDAYFKDAPRFLVNLFECHQDYQVTFYAF
jgi:hypothetical protein